MTKLNNNVKFFCSAFKTKSKKKQKLKVKTKVGA
jgi:hypothetical protein